MNLIVPLLSVLFYFLVTPILSARILGIVPAASYSHQVVFQPIWRELSLRGHKVTVLTTNPMNNPLLTNLTEIDLHSSYEHWNKININEMAHLNIFELFEVITKVGSDMIDQQLQHPDVQTLLKNETEHFDLLLIETIFPAMVAFSERFKCPFIQILSVDAPPEHYHVIGNPSHPVLNPDFMLPFSGELTFFQRLISSIFMLFFKYYNNMHVYPIQNLLIKKHFGNDYPSFQDILRNTSMLFVNTDLAFHQIRPLLPVVVQIGGGTHIRPAQPLPKDLKKHLDSASQGVIYFSLGSNVKSKHLSENTRNVLLQTFAELPYTVLWKFEQEDFPGKPNNVFISKWFPQQDVLRHPSIKLFITQGGLQSMEEAIYNHIPLVGIPFYGDQPNNVNNMVSKGLGLSIDLTVIEKTLLKKTILEVINNPKYRNKIRELAELARDQPMTGLERAVWWTEYVLRHKGAKHLRSPAMDLPLYQYFLLDVIGFCLLIVSITLFLLVKLVKLVFRVRRCFKSKSKEKVQ